MPKNTKGGNKTKKQGFIRKTKLCDELDTGQFVGRIEQNMGSKFLVLCEDGITRIGKASNKVKNTKDIRLIKDIFVIVSLREFERDTQNCDIIGFADMELIKTKAIFNKKKPMIDGYMNENEEELINFENI